MSSASPARRRLSNVLPFVGGALLLGYFIKSTDLPAVGAALQKADTVAFIAIAAIATVLIWLYDSLCLVWLVRQTLGHRGLPVGGRLRDLAPIKATSYVLNILNYHAASLGMAWLIGRRKGVSFLESAGALALMSYIDLVAVAGMVVVGLWVAPEVLAQNAALQTWLQVVTAAIFCVALVAMLVLQSGWQVPLLVRLRQISVLRPLAAMKPLAMLQGVVLRLGIVLAYTAAAFLVMRAFHMDPKLGRMLVVIPILTVVGTIPISVAGIGTTQVLMRMLYAPFLTAGQTTAVIDAFSSSMIVGYITCRMIVAAPFLRGILAELKGRPKED